jgi:hypothetical protein
MFFKQWNMSQKFSVCPTATWMHIWTPCITLQYSAVFCWGGWKHCTSGGTPSWHFERFSENNTSFQSHIDVIVILFIKPPYFWYIFIFQTTMTPSTLYPWDWFIQNHVINVSTKLADFSWITLYDLLFQNMKASKVAKTPRHEGCRIFVVVFQRKCCLCVSYTTDNIPYRFKHCFEILMLHSSQEVRICKGNKCYATSVHLIVFQFHNDVITVSTPIFNNLNRHCFVSSISIHYSPIRSFDAV